MGRFSASIDDDVQEDLEEYAEEHHDGNRSAAVETLVERGLEYDDVVQERDRLDRQLKQLIEQRETSDEIVEYVEVEKTLQERRARAGLVTRARWWLVGMDVDGDQDERP
jgi:metal-responsive CopG/Arc/MetJ family transcriptional regulator